MVRLNAPVMRILIMSNEGIVMSDRDNFEAWNKTKYRGLNYKVMPSGQYLHERVNLDYQIWLAALEHCKQGEPVAVVKDAGSFGKLIDLLPGASALNVGDKLFAHAMPKSEGKPYQLSNAEQGAIKKALIASTTPQPTTDISELVKCLIKISELCPVDSDVNQLDEHPLNTVRLTLAEVGDTARSAIDIIAKQHCTRSHPHENMDIACQMLTEHAKNTNRQAHRESLT